MPLTPWKLIRSEVVQDTRWCQFKKDVMTAPNGSEQDMYYIEQADAAVIIPLRDDGCIGMVRQYRPLLLRESLEFPAGMIDEGEKVVDAARRELEEEIGYTADHIELLGEFDVSPGRLKSATIALLATNLTKKSLAANENEEFEIEWFTKEEIDEKIISGEIREVAMVAAWHLAKTKSWLAKNN